MNQYIWKKKKERNFPELKVSFTLFANSSVQGSVSVGVGKDTKADKLTPYCANYSSPTRAKDIWDILRRSWEWHGTPSFSIHQCTFSWSQAQMIYHHDLTATIKSSSLLPPQSLDPALSWLPPISNYNINWHSNNTENIRLESLPGLKAPWLESMEAFVCAGSSACFVY